MELTTHSNTKISEQEEARIAKAKEPAYPKIEAATELLQQVLVNLLMRDLIVLQRVSKRWQTAILGWSQLRMALFFQPIEDLQLSLVEDTVASGMKPLKCISWWECPRDMVGCPVGTGWYHPAFGVTAGTTPGLPFGSTAGITRWAVDPSDKREYRIVINPLLGVEEPWEQMYFENDVKGKDKFGKKAYRR